ncbi:MAG TPA: hypothetical protein VFL57_15925 [Bryobacteraceae bacterium]|nr:hypothetical protein [Bryobacteraceae bacterium]
MAIAVAGVASAAGFGLSGRIREFGSGWNRISAAPRGVGRSRGSLGGGTGGYALAERGEQLFPQHNMEMPDAVSAASSAVVLLAAAAIASPARAVRAARGDVMEALAYD